MPQALDTKVCGLCGSPFVTSHPTKLYCSPECKREVKRIRSTEWRQEQLANDAEGFLARDRARGAEYRLANPDKTAARGRRYRAENAEAIRAYNADWKRQNRNRVNAYRAAWRERYPEKRRAEEAKRRARLFNAQGSHTEAEWLLVLQDYGYCCAYCAVALTLPSGRSRPTDATKDHFQPLAAKGTDFITNILPVCHSCNASKKNLDPLLWLLASPERLVPKLLGAPNPDTTKAIPTNG